MSDFRRVSQVEMARAQQDAGRRGEVAPDVLWVKSREPSAEDLNRAVDVVTASRQLLRKTLVKLGDARNTDVVAWGFFYFNTAQQAMAAEDREQIRKVLVAMQAGLEASVVLKLGREEEDAGRRGYTTMKTGDVNKSKGGLVKAWKPPLHNRVIDMRRSQEVTFGAIHISESRLNEALAPKTLLHEISHKYAGTHDYWLWNETGSRIDGEILIARNEPRWRQCSLMNADSYAWFVKIVGSDF